MSKIAVFTDTHANLPALQAALAAIQLEGCDAIYHTGDVIAIGPHPAECLDLLLSTPNMHPLIGNHEAWFVNGLPQPQPTWMSDEELAHQHWLHAQLDPAGTDHPAVKPILARWPYVIQTELEGVRVALMHYPPTGEPGAFVPVVRSQVASRLDALFASYPADVVFFGHDHAAYDVSGLGTGSVRARYVNPGSLGCHQEAIARFVTLVCEKGHYTLHKHAVPYDDALLFEDLEKRQVPARAFIRQVFFQRISQSRESS